ncbi:atos homolog atossa isoform X2 [Oratosquilla oratoria]|uniref:atos homolog atossa isoform X2 n=1 Tax=Oratosquilla oratoria TaxID=337810 RepID=UPI003F75CA33
MRASGETDGHGPGEAVDVFTALAILVVEGRTPGGGRGFHAGPHCPLPQHPISRHICQPNSNVCVRAEALVRQLRLMWGVGVGASVEVLIAPDCHHGANLAHTLDTATAPSNNLTLLEQWTFTIFDRRLPDASASGWSLLAAVRSFLHFSQLSAWLSKSGGCNPPNVLYRVTVPSPVFCSKFVAQAEEHVFPIAYVGQDTSIKVTVRTLPRSEIAPLPLCTEEHEEKFCAKAVYPHNTSVIVAPGPSSPKQDYGVNHKVEEDLRRSIVKARLAENNRISRSESPDTQLGESLLDPPNSLTRLSRRYQSPSRSGSPSLETPEHLICRPRSHAPLSTVRPPDAYTNSMSMTSRHPFAWTQSKFPIMPIPIHPSCTEPPPLPTTQTSGFHNDSVPLHSVNDGGGVYSMPYCGAYQQHGRPVPLYTGRTVWPQTLEPQSQFQVHQSIPSPGFCPMNQPGLRENFSPSSAGSSKHNVVISNGQLCGSDFKKTGGFDDPSHLPCKYRTSNCDVNYSRGDKVHLPTQSSNTETDPCSSNSLQMGEDYQSSPCTGTRLKQSKMHLEDKCVVDDLQWPCLQQGKHLCSSLEDLSDTCTKGDHSHLAMSEGDGKKCKTNFELTPRETLEVLSVLRQTAPLPPLRLDNHRNQADAQPEAKISCQDLSSPCTSKMEVADNSFHEANLLSMDSSPIESKTCMSASGSSINNLPNVFHSQDNKWCHSRDSGNAHKLRTSPTRYSLCPENRFLEAIARSAEKNCDISNKNSFKSERPFRTEEGFCRSQSCPSDYSVKSSSEISDNFMLSPCVEAKKLRMKTNFYTASSEPAKGSREFQRQTSKTLGKSPISAILSNLQKVYNEGNEESGESFKLCKESVCRALKFDEDFESPVRQDESAQNNSSSSSRVENCERGKANGEVLQVHKSVGTSPEIKEDFRANRENHGGFVKSASLLKQLMKSSSYLPSQGFSKDLNQLDNKPISTSRAENNENGLKDHEEVKDAIEELGSTNKEDAEVKSLLNGKNIPSASEKAQFRRSLDSATTLVFHSKTGLPLTSSPAPLRKGTRFDYDSSINSPSAIKSALCNCDSEEEDNANLDARNGNRSQRCDAKRVHPLSTSAPATVTCSNLLGSFEECVLNGRLEPVSTVQGFTAEIAASGAFCPKHLTLPVTVFFYTLCDNDQISSPYLGHINLGKKGYHVPNKGTVQVTLFNPHRTVVKMFVVMYDLSDMPANSRTFLRQRTLNMPVGVQGDDHPDAHQWLRYLIHLRFASSKSGKIYLHTDVRMLIFRKSDADAATLHKTNTPYELRSFTHGPVNPKFSPRK